MEEVTTFLAGDVSGLPYFYGEIEGIEEFCTLEEFSAALALRLEDTQDMVE